MPVGLFLCGHQGKRQAGMTFFLRNLHMPIFFRTFAVQRFPTEYPGEMKQLFLSTVTIAAMLLGACQSAAQSPPGKNGAAEEGGELVDVTEVIPDLLLEIRYYSTYNFVGERIDGYEGPVALLTRAAADSLKAVSDELRSRGYVLKIYDAYRPQQAVDHFVRWAKDLQDTTMKAYFYPELEKSRLIPEYIATKSGHSRGSTVDLTLVEMRTGKEADMGGPFDYFGMLSHATLQPGQPAGGRQPITEEQYRNRMVLREVMMRHGFVPYDGEWWHFRLKNEPYPKTYFSIPVRSGNQTPKKP